MILIIDVHYYDDKARIAGIAFDDWLTDKESHVYISDYEGVADYKSGAFYKRELPCILKLIEEHNLQPELIIIDGYVWLDGVKQTGMGARLHDSLAIKTPIIGVAKNKHSALGAGYDVVRGSSAKPLFVTAIGIDIDTAKSHIANMHGDFRQPTLIKKADSACRGYELA